MLTDEFNEEFLTGMPSNASTASHASLTIRIGALFFEPAKKSILRIVIINDF